MEVLLSDQLRLFAAALLGGAVLSLFYDLLRLTRLLCGEGPRSRRVPELSSLALPLLPPSRPRKKRKASAFFHAALLFAEDLLFCAVSAALLLILFYNFSRGRVRLLALFCAALGFSLCHATLGRAILLLFEALWLGIRVALRYLLFFLLFPFRRLVLPLFARLAALFAALARAAGDIVFLWRARRFDRGEQTRLLAGPRRFFTDYLNDHGGQI